MGVEDDQNWQFVRGRNRNRDGDRSHLPDIATVKNRRKGNFEDLTMLNAFSYYGDIVEVVIPAKRDKGGRRFGFARFEQVQDARLLEQELDTILVGRDKISVNLSRFHRFDAKKSGVFRREDGREVGGDCVRGGNKGEGTTATAVPRGVIQSKHISKGEKHSYANAVVTGKESIPSKPDQRVFMSFEVEKGVMDRYQKAFVGEVLQPGMTYNIQNAFHRQGYFGVKVTPLGANLTLLEGQEEGEVQALIDDAKTWLDQCTPVEFSGS
jgi:hypothetical protein